MRFHRRFQGFATKAHPANLNNAVAEQVAGQVWAVLLLGAGAEFAMAGAGAAPGRLRWLRYCGFCR